MKLTSRRGFTLIELLVVVAIIAILIAILMPALGKSKTQAIKTKCLANIRSTFTMARAYSTEYNDVIPLGAWAYKQFNYIVYQGSRPSAYGYVNQAGYITNGQVFYCPANETPSNMYNNVAAANPWRQYGTDPASYSGNTRLGYGMRPLANWLGLNGSTPPISVPIAVWTKADGTPVTSLNPGTQQRWPKISDFLNNAILSDITPNAAFLKERHKDGVNVLFGSGAGYWVPLKAFENSIIGSSGQPSTSMDDTARTFHEKWNNYMLDESTIPASGFFGDLDKYK